MTTIGERIRTARKAKRVTQQQLADHFNIARVSVTQWENDTTQPGRDKISGLVEMLGGDAEWFLTGQGKSPMTDGDTFIREIKADEDMTAVKPKPNASFPPRYQEFPQGHTIPLLGQTSGGPNGRFILNGTEIGRVFCPPMLEGVEGTYATMVYGTSMIPRFYPGETVWVNPHLPVRSGDDVIAQILEEGEDHPVDSYIKQFQSQSSKILRLHQYNPEEGESHELEFDRSKVFSVHKIVFHATV